MCSNLSDLSRALAALLLASLCALTSFGGEPNKQDRKNDRAMRSDGANPELAERAVRGHVSQADIDAGVWSVAQLREAGRRLFNARFTVHDGVGRPQATGNFSPRRRSAKNNTGFSRSAGPDSNSCASCHNNPVSGGSGDFTTGVFVGLGDQDPPVDGFVSAVSNERGTPAMQGTGIVEAIAREITEDLHSIRDKAVKLAVSSKQTVRRDLVSKSINFGAISALPNGEVLTDEVDGIDRDLVIRPFGQKGTVVSLREFTVTAANLHHGMQADERFSEPATGYKDFDADGVSSELTTGDITALTVYQATLNMPGRRLPHDAQSRQLVHQGEKVFESIGCASCHVPSFQLRSQTLLEPGPYNRRGTLIEDADTQPLIVDLSKDTPSPRIKASENGTFEVYLWTDFKRHAISDPEHPHFANEILVERSLPTNVFLTKRLWATGNTDPYGHRGDITTVYDAIMHHGGEAADSRKKFEHLSPRQQSSVVQFLRSLQILPDGSPPVVIAEPEIELPYSPD